MTTTVNTAMLLSMAIGTVLPILVGLVTKEVTSAGTKAVLLAALSALTAFLTQWLDAVNSANADWDWGTALLTCLATWITAVAIHFGFWKPTGGTDAAQRSLVK